MCNHIAKNHPRLTLIVAICLVPKSVETDSLERLLNFIYARAPFSTSKLLSTLAVADEVAAVLQASSTSVAVTETVPETEKTSGGLCSPSNTDEGYGSMDGASPQLQSDASQIAELDSGLSSNSCLLPTSESADATPLERSLPPLLPTRSATPLVLVVDDNMVKLRILQMYCKKRGLPFLSAAEGKQAVDIFSKHQAVCAAVGGASIELVLMDLQMPVCDGLDATEQIHSLEQDNSWGASVVFTVTGQDSHSDRQAASAVGADDYMVKPIGMARLDMEVKRYFPLFKARSG